MLRSVIPLVKDKVVFYVNIHYFLMDKYIITAKYGTRL